MLKRAYFGLFIVLAISRGQTLRKIGAIDLPGPKGERFDYLTMDDEDHYLLSAPWSGHHVRHRRAHQPTRQSDSGCARYHRPGIRPRTSQGLCVELGREQNRRRGSA